MIAFIAKKIMKTGEVKGNLTQLPNQELNIISDVLNKLP